MNELKKCPFCGGDNIISTYNNFVPALLCGGCGAMMTVPMGYDGKKEDELKRKWNTRKPVDDVVEALEEYIRFCELCHEEFKNASMSLTYEIQINSYKNAIEIVKEHLT